VRFVADINACGVRMHDFQTEVFALDFPGHLTPLLAVHLVPVAGSWAAACLFVFLHSFGLQASLSIVNSTWLGPVGDPYTVSPSGSGLCSFAEQRRHHLHNRQYQSHAPLAGRNAPDKYAALAVEPPCVSDFNLRQPARYSPFTLLIQFLLYNHPNGAGLAPFFQSISVMAAILRARVRRTMVGLMPLVSERW